MTRLRTLVVVLAGGAGGRLELLTHRRAKPAVPYGGTHRLIDFPLSNCLNSELTDVWVVQQFNPVSLGDHLSNGRPWDLDRTTGGLLLLSPHRGGQREGWHEGTADALWRQTELIRDFGPDHLIVMSADAVYRLDYAEVVSAHRTAGADATFVTSLVDPEDAERYGVVKIDGDRVSGYEYKPEHPEGNLVSAEIFVFEPRLVLDLLDGLARSAQASGDRGLTDLGDELLPRLVSEHDVLDYRLPGYWRDVGTIDAYWSSHMELLADEPPIDLGASDWSIRTVGGGQPSAWLARDAEVHRSLVAPGARVSGLVDGSVLSTGVVIESRALVRDSVLLPGARVESGAEVVRAIVDDGVVIGRNARVGGEGALALLGLGRAVAPSATLPPGTRHPDISSESD